MISSISAAVVAVLFCEAPSGSCRMAKMAPWSSSGRKPCGVALKVTPMRKKVPARMASERIETRTSRRTTQA